MNDAGIQQYLLDHDANKKGAAAAAHGTATRLETGELKLKDLIEGLDEYLNSDNGSTRAKTTSFLADVLAALPPKSLSLQQRTLLCNFILARTADSDASGIGIGACARALIALEERGRWDTERVHEVIETLLTNSSPLRQYRLQSERYPVLRLIDMLMAKYRDALRTLHETVPGFLSRFIAYFDGEKDPRNLMVVFSILKVPMAEWSIGADAQDLFDAVFNYFPITFRPPPDDPYGITAQDLKDRLRECMSTTAEFAPYAFPALLEKLDSTSVNTKRDVLQAITAAVTEYGPNTIALYSISLWDALKYEILNVQEEDLAEEALNGLAAIARTLSGGTSGPLNAYLRPIIKECNEHLEDAPTKQSQAAARILHKIANVSPEVSNIVLAGILPTLFSLFQASENMAKRRGLLEVFVQLLKANIDVYGSWRTVGAAGELSANALVQFREQALEVMTNGLESAPVAQVSFRVVCLDGLLQLSKARGLLTDEHIGKIIQLFYTLVIHEESYGKDDVKNGAINGLVEVAHQKPQVVIDMAFPAFMAQLPDTDRDGERGYVPVLEAFAKLASEPDIFDTVVLRLKNKFSSAVNGDASSAYVVALLSAILYALTKGANRLEQHSDTSTYYQGIALPLLQRTSSTDASHPKAFDDETTLDLVGRICSLIIRSQSAQQQQAVANELYTLFRHTSQDDLPPFNVNASPELNRTMVVSTHLLASLRRETRLPCEIELLVSCLANYSQELHLCVPVRLASLRQLTLLINKFYSASALKTCMVPLASAPLEIFDAEKLDPPRIRTIFACLKGIALRSSPSLTALYPQVMAFLSHPKYGTTVAYGFGTLLQPDDLLTKENHCQISGLHKQKSFALLVPDLTRLFREAAPDTKPNYLIALSGILKWTPFDIIMTDVDQLVLPLLQSLDLQGETMVKEAAIGTLASTLLEKPAVVEEHVGSLVTRLLANSVANKDLGPPPKVRAAALRCLSLVPDQLGLDVVLPYRRQVCKKLTAALDDPRREVRGAAVKCRAKWLEVDEAGDDE